MVRVVDLTLVVGVLDLDGVIVALLNGAWDSPSNGAAVVKVLGDGEHVVKVVWVAPSQVEVDLGRLVRWLPLDDERLAGLEHVVRAWGGELVGGENGTNKGGKGSERELHYV